MKKIIFLFGLFLMTGIVSNAQKIGIKAGLNISDLIVKDVSTTSLTGLQLGIVSNFDLSETVGFNTGLLYSQKGCKVDDGKIKLDYLEIPLNLSLQHEMDALGLFVQAGPYLGYGLSAKEIWEDEEYDLSFGSGEDDDLKQIDYGINIGAGVGINNLQIAANYSLGLADIQNEDYGEDNIKNTVLTLSLTYFFGQ